MATAYFVPSVNLETMRNELSEIATMRGAKGHGAGILVSTPGSSTDMFVLEGNDLVVDLFEEGETLSLCDMWYQVTDRVQLQRVPNYPMGIVTLKCL